MWGRDDDVGVDFGVEMVVNDYLGSFGGGEHWLHAVNAGGVIEVKTENEIGLREGCPGLTGMI